MHYDKGTMSPTDYETYKNLFDAMVMTPYFPHPDLLIYIEGPVEKIIERIQCRGREMEQQTSHDYWYEMHERYENWINNFNACPVLRITIDDYDLKKDEGAVEQIVKRIATMLEQTAHLRQ